MQRRDFLVRTGLAVGAGAILSTPGAARGAARPSRPPDDWDSVRALFDLDPDLVHLAGFFLASHPRPVRDAIERHRRAMDANPIAYVHDKARGRENDVRRAAGEYLGVDGPSQIALTDSTTMGLAIVYGGIRLAPGQEMLATNHDHYATKCSLTFRSERTGNPLRLIDLYDDGSRADAGQIVARIRDAITPSTRLVAVTWVHSSSGVKLPIRAIADMIAELNRGRGRDENSRVLLAVDGVHGHGVENATLPELGCDVFIAGTHKWMFGPRGTGLIWATPGAWAAIDPITPPFGPHSPPATLFTPGGFHSFEHRWAAAEAFKLHMQIGKARIHDRIHALNRQIREGLAKMSHVKLHTPMSDELSAGIVCFDVNGATPAQVVERLAAKRIVASESPYTPSCARLAGSLLVTPEQIDKTLAEVAVMA